MSTNHPMYCMICKKRLDVIGDVRSRNCGGDCLECMAESGDPDARLSIARAAVQSAKAILAIATDDQRRKDAELAQAKARVISRSLALAEAEARLKMLTEPKE